MDPAQHPGTEASAVVAVTLLHAYAWLALLLVIFLGFLKLGDWLADRGWL